MRLVFAIFLALGIQVASWMDVASQESGIPALAHELTQPVTYTDVEGNEVITLTVTEVDHDFGGYVNDQNADHGFSYRLVRFTLENTSNSTVNVNLKTFAIIDAFGYTHYRVEVEREIGYEYQDKIDVEAGDVVEQELVYELPIHAKSALFRWEPDFRMALLVNISPDGEAPSVAQGVQTPASVSDEFFSEIATVEVLFVQGEWDQHSDWSEPKDGEVYWALQIRVTNTTDQPIEVRRWRLSIIDQHGAMSRATWSGTPDDARDQVVDDAMVNSGETVEGLLVYALPEGDQPVVFVWEDRYGGSSAHVVLVDPSDAGTPDIESSEAD